MGVVFFLIGGPVYSVEHYSSNLSHAISHHGFSIAELPQLRRATPHGAWPVACALRLLRLECACQRRIRCASGGNCRKCSSAQYRRAGKAADGQSGGFGAALTENYSVKAGLPEPVGKSAQEHDAF